MTSEEVSQVVKNVAGNYWVWLGGSKADGEWTWSDNSSWGYTKWNQGQGNDGDDSCVNSNGNWDDDPCTIKFS